MSGLATQEEEFLKRYLEYCRVRCSPRLTQRAAANLATDYVEIREEVIDSNSTYPHLLTHDAIQGQVSYSHST